MQSAEKISITMTPEQLRAVRESVAAGEYASTSEVVRDAVRLWQCRRQEDAERLDVIHARIRRSLHDPRPALSLEEVDGNLTALFAEARKDRGRA
ncbi:ribbon-helix-helix domain-containing protein [uncultured Methylobacterium sp.]|jgi:antitoxin ParD1/3/4|uniref:ribbon-helix-helix domain-containing protein n=1 Tax=uncultured Methylobacterium sp. TaxID=157278 RepID=UPI0026209353|nr:ribbon-helix-helix domain-containing protein [uncultured Methylobacterium sp.]